MRDPVFVLCAHCGKEFVRGQIYIWKFYCSDECHDAARAAAQNAKQDKRRVQRRKWSRDRRAFIKGAEGSHTQEEWLQRVQELGWKCVYCGAKLTVATLTKDHMIALSQGGTDYVENLVPACRSCNSKKCNKPAISTFPQATTALNESPLLKAKTAPVRYEGMRTSWAWRNPSRRI